MKVQPLDQALQVLQTVPHHAELRLSEAAQSRQSLGPTDTAAQLNAWLSTHNAYSRILPATAPHGPDDMMQKDV